MKFGPLLYVCLFVSLTFYNCKESGVVYKEVLNVDSFGWKYQDQVSFENVVLSNDQRLYVRLAHADNYKYENINLKVSVANGVDTLLATTMSIDLANDIGQWKGKQKGDGFQVDEEIHHVLVESQSNLTVIIEQHSRDQALKGVQEVGLVVKELHSSD